MIVRNCIANTLLPIVVLCSSLGSAHGEIKIRIEVVEKRGSNTQGTPADIFINDNPNSVKTDRYGIAVLVLDECNESVIIRADPEMSHLDEPSKPCKGKSIILTATSIYGSLAAAILNLGYDDIAQHSAIAAERHVAFLVARENHSFGVAAKNASEVSVLMKVSNPSLAQAYSVLAMDSGYRALGVEPISPVNPLIAYDPLQEIFVMTPQGRRIINAYNLRADLPQKDWSGRTINRVALTTKAFNFTEFIIPPAVIDPKAIEIGPDGKLKFGE